MLRPIITVYTSFEKFEFFEFIDPSEGDYLLRFSTRYDAQFFLRRILDDTRDPSLLERLWCRIESPIIPCNHGNLLNRLADDLVGDHLKVKHTPLPPFQLSPAEFDYFTARFDELRENKQARTPLTRSDLPSVPEVVESLPPPQANPTFSETPVAKPSLSTTMVSKSMTVAALQMYSEDGQLQANLNTAEQLARDAKQANSELDLILFPELTSPGYGVGPSAIPPPQNSNPEEDPDFGPDRQKLAQDLWNAAEPSSGNQTLQKLQAMAKELQVMIGASFLESDGKDFYVTFVLFGRDGQEVGRVRKQKASAQEAYYVASAAPQSHVLTVNDPQLGSLKIGVGICYENYHVQLPCHFQQEGVDLVLQPHSANIMNLDGEPLAKLYANTLGVPVVMVNKYNPDKGFPGNSAIAYFDNEGKFDMERPPLKKKEEAENSSTTEVEPPVEQTGSEQEISFTATFPLKKTTSRPINCDPSVIGTEPQLWPEALIPFSDYPAWESSQHLETFAVLQEKIDQIVMISHELNQLQSLVGTDPQSWPAISRSLDVLLLKTIPLLKPEEALPYASLLKDLPPLEAKEALREDITDEHINNLKDLLLILPELEKLKSLMGTTIDIKDFFEEVEKKGGKFYDTEYVKERIAKAKEIAGRSNS